MSTLRSAVLCATGLLAPAMAQTCTPDWIPSFDGARGPDGAVFRCEVADIGAGPEVILAGSFDMVGDLSSPKVAAFDGQTWRAMSAGLDMSLNSVFDIQVFDSGAGPELYISGYIRLEDGTNLAIAKWDGATWAAAPGAEEGIISNMLVFDDGSGPALYGLGSLRNGGAIVFHGLGRWDGTSWTNALNGTLIGSAGTFGALTVFDDGTGPAIYLGGKAMRFDDPQGTGVEIEGIAKVVAGVPEAMATWPGYSDDQKVTALTSYDTGSGSELYVGYHEGNVPFPGRGKIRRWDGTTWLNVGSSLGSNFFLNDLEVFDDGSGERLYAGGVFPQTAIPGARVLAAYDGTGWVEVAGGMDGGGLTTVNSLTSGDLGNGPRLICGGDFAVAGGDPTGNIAQFDGASWDGLTADPMGLSDLVQALTVHDDGSGEALYVGGFFDTAGDVVAPSIARWNGFQWSAVGTGMTGSFLYTGVAAFAQFDDGSGPALYAAGSFATAGGVPCENVARWDGTQWSAVGSGLTGSYLSPREVRDLAVYDDGSGAALYACGTFRFAGGQTVNGVARWDGVSWSALGAGAPVAPSSGFVQIVDALHVYDDGVTGPMLYAGGAFDSMDGVPGTSRLARWDGLQWQPVGAGIADGQVGELMTVTSGGASTLWIGGAFRMQQGGPTELLADWNGAAYTSRTGNIDAGQDISMVTSMTMHDDGTGAGSRLYVAGPGPSVAQPDWSTIRYLDAGVWVAPPAGPIGWIDALQSFDDGAGFGPSLFVGGNFSPLSSIDDRNLARFGGCTLGKVGRRYCNSTPNSTGTQGRTTGFGSTETQRNELSLIALDLPMSSFGVFLTSTQQGFATAPNTQGVLCLAGAIGRFVGPGQIGFSGSQGSFELALDLTTLPQPTGSVSVLAGQTWNFQAWYRDAVPFVTSNFTDAIAVQFR